MVIIGDKELTSSKISVRTREGKDRGAMEINEFIQTLKNQH
jgi:threonyl-tRNA synthetase